MRYKDFKELQKLKVFQAKKKARSTLFPETSKQEAENDDLRLFNQAMQGVNPLKNKGGRQTLPKKTSPDFIEPQKKQCGQSYLNQLLQGEIEFEIEFTEEFLYGNVKGLDPKTFRKLKAGSLSPEAHLDLHGFNLESAYLQLIAFVRDSYLAGRRCVLLIPGRGKNSPQGRSVLREHLQTWLTRDPLKRVVLAFSTARPQHGGAGAIYLLLRKFKKSRGKIIWERYLAGTE